MNNTEKKAVFLLNTHLSNIINAPGYLIEYLDEIIQIFNKIPDAVLLWRPHPLSDATFQSISGTYYEDYQKRVSMVSQMSNGIVDRTSDIDRAIVLSDAYIGDISSSVTTLYAVSQKPMLLVEPLRDVWKEVPFRFTAAAGYKDKIYISAIDFNGLFSLDIQTGSLDYIGRFTTEENKIRLYRLAYVYENACWFIPEEGSYITKVNLDTLEMYQYDLPALVNPKRKHAGSQLKFVNVVKDEEQNLWLIPYDYDILAKIDLRTSELSFYDAWPFDYEKRSFLGGVVVGGELWLYPGNARCIVKVNLKNGQMQAVEWKYPPGSFNGFIYSDDSLWLVPERERYVIRWNLKNNEETMIEIPKGHEQDSFLGGCVYDGKIWMYPFCGKGILRINIESQRAEYIDKGWNPCESNDIVLRICNTPSFMLISRYGGIATFDQAKMCFVHRCLKLNIEQYRKLREGIVQPDSHSEKPLFLRDITVEQFVNIAAVKKTRVKSNLMEAEEESGRKIWEHIKHEIEG